MAVTYVGQKNFIQVSEPIIRKTDWGLDEVTVRWQGSRPKLAEFLHGLNQGSPNPAIPGVVLSTWGADENRVYPSVDLVYVGFLKGVLPTPILEYGSSIQTAVKEVGDVGDYQGAKREITFIAPTRTARYFSVTNVLTPESPYDALGSLSVSYTILKSVITATDADGKPVSFVGNAPAELVSALSVSPVARVIDHKSTPVPPPIVVVWSVETTTTLDLI